MSVIVPTYDQWPRLRLALLGFTRIRTRDPWELIVVDDGCATPIAELVAREPRLDALPIAIERLDVNRGRSLARNHGVAAARGRICLFLDGDAVPHPSWIEGHVRLHRDGARVFTLGHIRSLPSTELFSDPSTGVLFDHMSLSPEQYSALELYRDRMIVTDTQILGDIDALYARSQWGSLPMPAELVARWLAWLLHRDRPGVPPLLWSRFVPHNAAVARRDFEAVGGFDASFTFYEGVDLAYRLTKIGARPCVAERAISMQLYHFHDFTSPRSDEIARRARGAAQLLGKHPTPEMAVVASALTQSSRPEESQLIHPSDAIAALRDGAHGDHAKLVRLHPVLCTPVAAFPVASDSARAAEPAPHAAGPTEWISLSAWIATLVRDTGASRGAAEKLASRLPAELRSVHAGSTVVDRRGAETWALLNDPAYYESWLQMDANRMAFIRSARRSRRPAVATYRFEYTTTLDVSQVPLGMMLRVDLPFPRDAENQRIVRLLHSDPPIDDHVLAHAGCVYGLKVRRGTSDRVVMRYGVELEVAEVRRRATHSRPLSRGRRDALARFLELPRHDVEGVHRTLSALTTGKDRAPHVVARAIRDWVLANVRFTLVERCSCAACCLSDLERVREGGCAFIAGVFVALARAAGIPARLVRGSLMGLPAAVPDAFHTRTTNLGFGHRWAEFFAEPAGWIPVEFHSCVLRPPFLSERNAPSAARRDAILVDGEECADYLFGSLDNQRVRCGTFAYGVSSTPTTGASVATVTEVAMTRLPVDAAEAAA